MGRHTHQGSLEHARLLLIIQKSHVLLQLQFSLGCSETYTHTHTNKSFLKKFGVRDKPVPLIQCFIHAFV